MGLSETLLEFGLTVKTSAPNKEKYLAALSKLIEDEVRLIAVAVLREFASGAMKKIKEAETETPASI